MAPPSTPVILVAAADARTPTRTSRKGRDGRYRSMLSPVSDATRNRRRYRSLKRCGHAAQSPGEGEFIGEVHEAAPCAIMPASGCTNFRSSLAVDAELGIAALADRCGYAASVRDGSVPGSPARHRTGRRRSRFARPADIPNTIRAAATHRWLSILAESDRLGVAEIGIEATEPREMRIVERIAVERLAPALPHHMILVKEPHPLVGTKVAATA